jgi:hypothetical protein
VERLLWREDGSDICNCCWLSPAQSFSGPSPAGLVIFYCLTTSQTWRTRFPYLYPPGTGFLFVDSYELRWRHSTPPPHGKVVLYIYIISGHTAEKKPPPTVPFLLAYFPCVWTWYPLLLLDKGSTNTFRGNKYKRNKRIAGRAVFNTARVLWKESRLFFL